MNKAGTDPKSDTPGEIETDLRLLFVDADDLTGDRPINVSCLWHPDQDTDSLAVWADHGFCFGGCPEGVPRDRPEDRKYKYRSDFVAAIGKEPPKRTTPKVQRDIIPPERIPDLVVQYRRNLNLLGKDQYFTDRGLSRQTIDTAQLGYTGRSFAIPIYSWGDLKTIRFRVDPAVDPAERRKYWALVGYNDPYLFTPVPVENWIVLCEGEIDCLTAAQCGYPAVTVTNGVGADLADALAQLASRGVREVRLAQDNDLASYEKSLQTARQIKSAIAGVRVRYCRFPFKDVNQLFLAEGESGVSRYLGVKRPL